MVATDSDPQVLELLKYNIQQNAQGTDIPIVEELDWYIYLFNNVGCPGIIQGCH